MEDDWGDARVAAAIRELVRLQAQGGEWEREALQVALPAVLGGEGARFLEWARHHLRWSLVVAEVAAEVCAKPAEAAPTLLLEIAREELED